MLESSFPNTPQTPSLDQPNQISYIDNSTYQTMVGFLSERTTRVAKPAKKTTSEKKRPTFNIKALLARRIDLPGGKKLNRDVKAPKPVRAIGGYFKGAFQELRQVRWPTRRATWGLTMAVIVFTLILTAFILGLDYAFEQLFRKVIL